MSYNSDSDEDIGTSRSPSPSWKHRRLDSVLDDDDTEDVRNWYDLTKRYAFATCLITNKMKFTIKNDHNYQPVRTSSIQTCTTGTQTSSELSINKSETFKTTSDASTQVKQKITKNTADASTQVKPKVTLNENTRNQTTMLRHDPESMDAKSDTSITANDSDETTFLDPQGPPQKLALTYLDYRVGKTQSIPNAIFHQSFKYSKKLQFLRNLGPTTLEQIVKDCHFNRPNDTTVLEIRNQLHISEDNPSALWNKRFIRHLRHEVTSFQGKRLPLVAALKLTSLVKAESIRSIPDLMEAWKDKIAIISIKKEFLQRTEVQKNSHQFETYFKRCRSFIDDGQYFVMFENLKFPNHPYLPRADLSYQ